MKLENNLNPVTKPFKTDDSLISLQSLCVIDDWFELMAGTFAVYLNPQAAMAGAILGAMAVPLVAEVDKHTAHVSEGEARLRRISSLYLTVAAASIMHHGLNRSYEQAVPAALLGTWGMWSLIRTTNHLTAPTLSAKIRSVH